MCWVNLGTHDFTSHPRLAWLASLSRDTLEPFVFHKCWRTSAHKGILLLDRPTYEVFPSLVLVFGRNEIFLQVLSAPRDESYEQANMQDVASRPIIHLLFNTQESSPEKLLPWAQPTPFDPWGLVIYLLLVSMEPQDLNCLHLSTILWHLKCLSPSGPREVFILHLPDFQLRPTLTMPCCLIRKRDGVGVFF